MRSPRRRRAWWSALTWITNPSSTMHEPVMPEANEKSCHLCRIGNRSPATGWNNEERRSLEQRGPADVVMALALIHHLVIGNNVPLDRVAELFRRVCRYVIVEFVPKEDSQVTRMLMLREDVFEAYSQAGFEQAFAPLFKSCAQRQSMEPCERSISWSADDARNGREAHRPQAQMPQRRPR